MFLEIFAFELLPSQPTVLQTGGRNTAQRQTWHMLGTVGFEPVSDAYDLYLLLHVPP